MMFGVVCLVVYDWLDCGFWFEVVVFCFKVGGLFCRSFLVFVLCQVAGLWFMYCLFVSFLGLGIWSYCFHSSSWVLQLVLSLWCFVCLEVLGCLYGSLRAGVGYLHWDMIWVYWCFSVVVFADCVFGFALVIRFRYMMV